MQLRSITNFRSLPQPIPSLSPIAFFFPSKPAPRLLDARRIQVVPIPRTYRIADHGLTVPIDAVMERLP